jgi:hypothetical protein
MSEVVGAAWRVQMVAKRHHRRDILVKYVNEVQNKVKKILTE